MSRNRLVLRHLAARPMRTVLTIAAFGFSVGLLGFLFVMNEAFQKDFSPNAARRAIVVSKMSFFDKLPVAYLAKIEQAPGVEIVIPFDFFMTAFKDSRPENQVPLGAAPAEPFLVVYKEANIPDDEKEAWLADPRGGVVGRKLAAKHGWKLGDKVVLQAPVKGGSIEFTVRALMRYDLDYSVYLHRRYLEGLSDVEGQAAMFWILVKSKEEVQPLTAHLEKEFANAPIPIRAMTERQWQNFFMQMIGNVKALIGSIGVATAFALLLITSNTLAMAARERRSEAALLRILGFSRGDVARQLLVEALVYGLAGAVLGGLLTFAFSRLVGKAIDGTQLAGLGSLLVPDAGSLAVCAAISLVLALIAGFVPAFGLSRRSIVELLREAS